MKDFFLGVFLFFLLRWLALLYNLFRFPRLIPFSAASSACAVPSEGSGKALPGPPSQRKLGRGGLPGPPAWLLPSRGGLPGPPAWRKPGWGGIRPTASLLVPARNEAENLEATLPRLLRQGALEVLVLDDASEDGTAEVVRRLAKAHPTLRLLPGRPLPPGWTGKNWACWQLAQEARGEVLVFTDADVLWEEGALEGLLEALRRHDLVSALPRQEANGLLLGGSVPFVMHGLFAFLPHPLLEALRVANGQVLAFRREAYFAQGGHQAVRGEVLEDVALARRARRYRLLLGSEAFRVRMYRTYLEAVEGFGKNFLEIHLKNPALLLGSAFYHLALYTLPWAYGEVGLGLLGILERLFIQWAFRAPLWPALLAPLSPLLLLPVYLRALLPGKRWKGRPL